MGPEEPSTSKTARYLPQMLTASAAVTLIPLAAIWGLRSSGMITSPWVGVPLAIAISLVVSAVGTAYWKRRRPAPELLFSELMLWGWLRRRRAERAIRNADELINHARELNPEHRPHVLRQLAGSLELQDPYTVGHSHRVARHSVLVARKLGLPGEQRRAVRTAAAIHDVGKLCIDTGVLNKPGRLTADEYEAVKLHASEGARLVSVLGNEQLTAIVRHHHERLDGSGYPAGLAGEQIPLGSRIIAVADTFDAITSSRPYRPARAHKLALDVLREESGRQLDGHVVDAFIECYAGKRAVIAWATLSSAMQSALAAISRSAGRSPMPVRISPVRTMSSTATMSAIAGIAIAAPISLHHHRLHRTPPPPKTLAAAPLAPVTGVRAAHRTHKSARRRAPSRTVRPVTPPPAVLAPPIVRTQLAAATTTTRGPGLYGSSQSTPPPPHRKRPPPAHQKPPPTTTTTTTTTTPPPTTSAPPPPASFAAPPPPTITTTTTSTTTSTTTTTTTTTETTTDNEDHCKDGGYSSLGYSNQGGCESDRHGHHGHHGHPGH